MNKRRNFLSLLAAAPWLARGAWAQPTARLPKLAILSPGAADSVHQPALAGFMQGLRELGYADRKNVSLEFRFADQALDRLPALAAELVRLRPDVLYTYTSAAAVAAARATTTIPIVVGPAGEQIMLDLAGSLARPTGNVTGTTLTNTQWDQKCVQLLKEIAPRTSKVAVLVNPDNPGYLDYPRGLEESFRDLGMTFVRIEARGAADVPQAFAAIAASGADAIFMADDSVLAGTQEVRARFIEAAASRRLPLVSSHGPVAADGGLLSLGTDIGALARRAAHHVHRILRGAKPGDLPIERPTTFKLTLNRKTAVALGLTIPQGMLMRADEVIR